MESPSVTAVRAKALDLHRRFMMEKEEVKGLSPPEVDALCRRYMDEAEDFGPGTLAVFGAIMTGEQYKLSTEKWFAHNQANPCEFGHVLLAAWHFGLTNVPPFNISPAPTYVKRCVEND